MAFAGPLGISAARWGMELEPIDDAQTDAMMWIEVDFAGIMRVVPGRAFKRRIQRVSDLEMVVIKSAVESDTSAGARHYPNAAEFERARVTQTGRTQERLIETYRKKAKHYDITSRLYPAPGYPQRAQRRRAVEALATSHR